jgi:hypothetical protein
MPELETDSKLVQEYQYGFETVSPGRTPQGPQRGHRPRHFGQEKRAGMDDRMAPEGLSSLAQDEGADLGALDYPKIDFQDIRYYSAPKKAGEGGREVDPELAKTFEKLGVPLYERARLAGVAVDAVFDSVSVGTTHQAHAGREGHHLLLDVRGHSTIPSW